MKTSTLISRMQTACFASGLGLKKGIPALFGITYRAFQYWQAGTVNPSKHTAYLVTKKLRAIELDLEVER